MSIRELLDRYGLEPRRSMGQNFLVAERYLERIVDAAEVNAEDEVLEIGPGLGGLTRLLAERARRVVAVELDKQLVTVLQETLADRPNVEIVQADILTVDVGKLMAATGAPRPYKVVANLPYNITSVVLRHLLESDPRPAQLVLMVQKEVAQRIVAAPGDLSLLAVSVQFYGKPRIAVRVPAGAFYPVPKVDSAVLRIDTYSEPPVAVQDVSRFFTLVRAGFGQRRKQLRNSLAQGLHLPPTVVEERMREAGIDPQRRAETISLAEWARLLSSFSSLPFPAEPDHRAPAPDASP